MPKHDITFFQSLVTRLRGLTDESAWILIGIGAVVLGIGDWELLLTLVKWASFAAVAAGTSIILSRVAFPTLRFKDLLEEVIVGKNTGAGVIIASIVIFCSIAFYTVIYWSK